MDCHNIVSRTVSVQFQYQMSKIKQKEFNNNNNNKKDAAVLCIYMIQILIHVWKMFKLFIASNSVQWLISDQLLAEPLPRMWLLFLSVEVIV